MRRNLFVLISFVFLTFVLFWPVFLGKVNINGQMLVSLNGVYGENISFKNIGYDQLRIYYPSYKFTVSQFKNFKLPLWSPYSFAGQPHVAELQSAVFYPLNIFSLVLPLDAFWNFLRLTPSILAAFFMYLYLKRLKLSGLAAFFGGLSWGFSPFILTWGEEQIITPHAVVWLPLALLGVEGLAEKKLTVKRISFCLIAISVLCSLLAGFIQLSLYLLMLIVLYAFFRYAFKRRFFLVLGAVVAGIGLSAVQLLPSVELFLNSPRSAVLSRETAVKFLLPFYSVFSYFAPDIFGNPATYNFFREGAAVYYEGILFVGIAVLIFSLFSVVNLKRPAVTFFGCVLLTSLLLTIDSPIARLVMSLPIPILSSSIANRILFVPAFCLVMLASFGFDQWLVQKKSNILRILMVLFFGYLLLILSAFLVKNFSTSHGHDNLISISHGGVALRNLVIPFLVFLGTAVLIVFSGFRPTFKKAAAVLIIIIAFGHIFYFAAKFFSFSEKKFVFPQTSAISYLQKHQDSQRVWAQGGNHLLNNFPTYYGLNWPEGYKSLFITSYWELAGAMQKGVVGNMKSRADVSLGALVEAKDVIDNQNRRRLIDLMGIKYVISDNANSQIYEKSNFVKVFKDRDTAVFENKQAVPRIFLASNYQGPPDIFGGGESQSQKRVKEAARRKLISQKLLTPNFDYRNTVILEKPSPISPQFGPGSIKILRDDPGEILVKTTSTVPKLLYVSDNYYPGWKASVDGNETEILRANYTFRAVPLAPGEHMVRMYYDPWLFKVGVIVSLVSLGVTLLLLKSEILISKS